uniref:Ras-related small GTP-binding family protein n=1 Tax=Rhizophora mucronata TaxID=61149 RepID=A0A2P2IZR0_RHIMU
MSALWRYSCAALSAGWVTEKVSSGCHSTLNSRKLLDIRIDLVLECYFHTELEWRFSCLESMLMWSFLYIDVSSFHIHSP